MPSTQVPDMLVAALALVLRFRPRFLGLSTPQRRFRFIRLPISHLTAALAALVCWNVYYLDS